MKPFLLLSALLVSMVVSTAGCDGEATSLHFDSPQEAYAAFADAAKNEDWATAARSLNGDSQAMMASSMVMGASIMAGADKEQNDSLNQLLASHGVDLSEPEPPADSETFDPETYDPQAGMKQMVAPVANLPEFIGQVTDWMKQTGKESPGGMAEMRELGEVKIDGETAMAICQTDMGPQPIGFIQQHGGWLVDLTVEPSPDQMQSSGPEHGGLDQESLDRPGADSDAPSLGKITYGDEQVELRHALAYRSKFFDDPCIDVVLTAKPVYDRGLKRLKKSLREEGNGMGFFPSGPNIRLSIDEQGELVDVFAWIDNVSMGLTGETEIEVQIEGERIHGTAALVEPKSIGARDRDFQFDVAFDVELMPID